MDGTEPPGLGVGGGDLRVTGAEGEAGVGLPGVGEPADLLEVMDGQGIAPVGEHAAASHGGELSGIADKHQPPPVGLREPDEPGDVLGARHAAFVEDHGCARR